ncbi:MAG TPA: aspartate aminotransferase family protein [Herpetosiphonaceae bacterium]|nr:aspartate aminotransferase family protein [Herpetosiphonaceae bacterium]
MSDLSHDAIIAQSEQYILPLYKRSPIALVGGEGVWLRDADGKRYLDGLAGIAVNALGYGDRDVIAAIQQAAEGLLHTSNLYYTAPGAQLAERLVGLTPWASRAFFCNSGTEAIEAALKFARRHAHNIAPGGKTELVACADSFHGRSMGALSVTYREAYRAPFNPLIPGVSFLKLNSDAAAIAELVTERTAGVIVEPIQGEGGVRPATPEFLRALRERCDEVGALLIFDEIQCGLGRTGDIWGHQASGVAPDIMAIAKPLGGGLPIGAALVNEKAAAALSYGDHGTTYGGNPLVCAVANVVLDKLTAPALLEHVRSVGAELGAGLRDLGERYDSISDVRGRGLMWGVEFRGVPAATVVEAAQDAGVLLAGAGPDTVRIVPPLILSAAEAGELVARLGRAVEAVASS